MPVTVIVGGQFGSEGKGKVAYFLANEMNATAAIRVGGPNSGHTVISPNGLPVVFRQLPTAALLPNVQCVLAAGTYLDADILLHEIASVGLTPDRVAIDPHAVIITDGDRQRELKRGLRARIGSTLSGTGAAVQRRIDRDITATFAKDDFRLKMYVRQTVPLLRELLGDGQRVIIEGTQGFGLSLLHGTDYPYVTSRDTTAAAFVSEAGLSPLDIDDVVLVLRAFPIRVPGLSGRLPQEIDWDSLTRQANTRTDLVEHTSVTHAVRRVARFDCEVVLLAMQVNSPTRVVLNHLDYVDAQAHAGNITQRVVAFVEAVEAALRRRVDYYGFSPAHLAQSSSSRRLSTRSVAAG